jgi:hypothetical protein
MAATDAEDAEDAEGLADGTSRDAVRTRAGRRIANTLMEMQG